MHNRRVVATALLAFACSCADAHEPPVRCAAGICPEGLLCLADEGAVCVPRCELRRVSRCDDGAACSLYRGEGVCWPGRAVTEGNTATTQYECSFGLRTHPDYEAEPVRAVCEPVCNTSMDCRAGEQCDGSVCVAPCRGSTGEPCATTSYCVTNTRPGICVNERRFTRIDCNGDRDLVPECTPSLMCDPEDPARCLHVPPGEE